MSKQDSIKRMLSLAHRLDAIVAEMNARKEIMMQDMYATAA
ncbi:hypothetical protein [Serratia ureilytica]|nr:hypothetical protein [Serratia ureilytica]